ncbi:DUF4956 domain-containing protein [uncultured Parabacteroides sp.]|uniref:DUF4956 domain-containing protein n=1 Tax=uncultured Parabacteroides sp. TaxID=512312 RepID=UPI00259B412B|nr:DUF4956 domain-containing protein [uncultured Parabacteroides sp.]
MYDSFTYEVYKMSFFYHPPGLPPPPIFPPPPGPLDNALSAQISYVELIVTNCIFILVTWLLESERWLKHVSCKLILYDKTQLIVPEKREELIADLRHRTGLNIQKIEIGHIDFLHDAALIKVYYESEVREINSVDTVTRFLGK